MYMSFLCSLNINPFTHICFADIFFQKIVGLVWFGFVLGQTKKQTKTKTKKTSWNVFCCFCFKNLSSNSLENKDFVLNDSTCMLMV